MLKFRVLCGTSVISHSVVGVLMVSQQEQELFPGVIRLRLE